MLPSDGPMQVITRDLQSPSKEHSNNNESMIKWRRLSDLQSIGASQKETKRRRKNNLVNDSINGDFLQSIEKEEKTENH